MRAPEDRFHIYIIRPPNLSAETALNWSKRLLQEELRRTIYYRGLSRMMREVTFVISFASVQALLLSIAADARSDANSSIIQEKASRSRMIPL